MSAHCHHHPSPSASYPGYRRALWAALALNAAMFALEIGAGLHAGSTALLADALDFLGDAMNYGLSLAVMGLGLGLGLAWRSRLALLKGWSMAVYGLLVLGKTVWMLGSGSVPDPLTMGAVGLLALLVNAGVAGLLYAWRDGGADMRAVWLCSRNDAIGNLAVLAAALGVFGSGSRWPDAMVALLMAALALLAARTVITQARQELRMAR